MTFIKPQRGPQVILRELPEAELISVKSLWAVAPRVRDGASKTVVILLSASSRALTDLFFFGGGKSSKCGLVALDLAHGVPSLSSPSTLSLVQGPLVAVIKRDCRQIEHVLPRI